MEERYRRSWVHVQVLGASRYLVVAHGGILNAAMCYIVGAPPPLNGIGIHFGFGDGGFTETVYEPDTGNWIILRVCSVHEGGSILFKSRYHLSTHFLSDTLSAIQPAAIACYHIQGLKSQLIVHRFGSRTVIAQRHPQDDSIDALLP